jgi:hypothetical protein
VSEVVENKIFGQAFKDPIEPLFAKKGENEKTDGLFSFKIPFNNEKMQFPVNLFG